MTILVILYFFQWYQFLILILIAITWSIIRLSSNDPISDLVAFSVEIELAVLISLKLSAY